MKNNLFYLLIVAAVCFSSCSNSPTEKAQSSVKDYLKENLKNAASYESIHFSQLDTLKVADTSEAKLISLYEISHIYSINNSDNEKVKMTIAFYLDKDLKVNRTNTTSINGDYGILTGNAYWKYNNYIGNKPDAGCEIELHSLDTVRGNLKYSASTDVQGNYRIEKAFPGWYLLVVRSNNATDCPEKHLSNLKIHKAEIKQLFGFDLNKYQAQLDELSVLDSLYSKNVDEFPSNGSISQMTANLNKTNAIEKERREKAEKIIESFPDDFKRKIKLYSGYSKAYDFKTIRIEEGKTENNISDFGITCI
jgi:hypothetical protein